MGFRPVSLIGKTGWKPVLLRNEDGLEARPTEILLLAEP